MATCLSITELLSAQNCGEDLIAGISKLYMIAYQDLKALTGTPFPYSQATGGVISAIGLQTGKHFVEIGLLKDTTGLNVTGVFNENGTRYKTVDLAVTLQGITAENSAWVDNVSGQEIAVIVLDKSGVYYTAGLRGNLKMNGYTGGLGTAPSDDKGFKLTFQSNDAFGIKLLAQDGADDAIAPIA